MFILKGMMFILKLSLTHLNLHSLSRDILAKGCLLNKYRKVRKKIRHTVGNEKTKFRAADEWILLLHWRPKNHLSFCFVDGPSKIFNISNNVGRP